MNYTSRLRDNHKTTDDFPAISIAFCKSAKLIKNSNDDYQINNFFLLSFRLFLFKNV